MSSIQDYIGAVVIGILGWHEPTPEKRDSRNVAQEEHKLPLDRAVQKLQTREQLRRFLSSYGPKKVLTINPAK